MGEKRIFQVPIWRKYEFEKFGRTAELKKKQIELLSAFLSLVDTPTVWFHNAVGSIGDRISQRQAAAKRTHEVGHLFYHTFS